jgi:hypothetical protein
MTTEHIVERALWNRNVHLAGVIVCGRQPSALIFTLANHRGRGCDLPSMVQTCAVRVGPVSTARTGTPAKTSMSMSATVSLVRQLATGFWFAMCSSAQVAQLRCL